MALNKLLLIGGSTAVVALASVVGVGAVSAESGTTAGNDSIVIKISQKFNLNKADVQKVFTEDKAAHDAQRQVNVKAKLDIAVKEGKITADQETKLIAKLAERATNREANRTAMQSMTATERKAAMDKNKADFDAWLKANNIPTDLLPQHGIGHGGRGMHGDAPATSTATSNTN
jgi:hypothetical protein